ncbi:DUF5986 family protein [Secundilactobacillus folii]|uniref:Uncharacterized protein n=1 Tax=Secundilactobacillus folii TaxID=2678357 RepID=A0A7X2XV62_9LACO|nr:DUF5986 family protein [Secundilactobacillus folii]MTV82196.1 hypothetical protein [Secundilactobacillus folii]
MEPNPIILRSVVEAMSITVRDVLADFNASISSVNHNGLYQAVWARRGQVVTNMLADNETIKVVHVHHKSIWQFEAIVDTDQRDAYLLMSHDNLKALQKKFKKQSSSHHHYLYSFLCLNPKPTSTQQSLFQSDENEEAARKSDCDIMLGEFANQIDRVYVVAFDYAENTATGGAIYLLDQNGTTIETKDISDMLLDQEETSENDSLGTDPIKHSSKPTPLVKLKIKKA